MKTNNNNKKPGAQGADQLAKKEEKTQDTKQNTPTQEKHSGDSDQENNNLDVEPRNMELEIVGMSGALIDGFNVTEKGMPKEGEAFWEENKATKLRSVTYYFKEDATLEQLGPPPSDFPPMLLKTRITLVD